MASSSLSLSVVTQDPTLATPTNPFKRDNPVLKDTACGQQTRFYSNGPNGVITLKRWRTALYHRYVNLLQARGGYTVVWRDTDARNEPVECGDSYLDCSNPDIPDDLGKTFIQIRGRAAKPKITITLYFHMRRKTGGTCLIQGHNKDTWVLSEYDSLCTFVQQLKDGCADPADNVPVDMPRDQSCDPIISPIVSFPDTPPRPILDSSLPLIGLEADDSTSLSPIVQSCNPRNSSANLVPEPLTVTTVSAVSDMTSPPTPPSIPHPSSSGPHLLDDLHSTLSDHSDVPAGQSLATTPSTPEPAPFTPSPVSHIVTQVASTGDVTPEDLTSPGLPVSCTQVDSDYSELVVSGVRDEKPLIILKLQTQLCNSQAAVEALHQELCQLRTVTMLNIKQIDSKVCESSVKMANDLRMLESCMCGKLSHLHDKLTNMAEFHCLVDDTLQRLNSEQGLPVASGQTPQLLVSTTPEGSMPVNSDATTSVKPVSTTAGDVIPVRITVPKNNPPSSQKEQAPGSAEITVNVASPIADNHREESGPSQPGQRQGGGNRIAGSQQQRKDFLPCERVFDHSVDVDTTTLVIGDSVVRNFKGEKMTMYQGEKVQVISISGLQISHLTDWLKQQPQSPRVQLVTFHVGVNDCKTHEITSQQWERLVTSCKGVFPKASIQASSILPAAQGKNSRLNQRISPSNANLCHVAKKMRAIFVDNAGVFLAPSGLPRKALYRVDNKGRLDPIHPSHVGTRRLAGNIKYGGPAVNQADAITHQHRSSQATTKTKLYSEALAGGSLNVQSGTSTSDTIVSGSAGPTSPVQPPLRQEPQPQDHEQLQQQEQLQLQQAQQQHLQQEQQHLQQMPFMPVPDWQQLQYHHLLQIHTNSSTAAPWQQPQYPDGCHGVWSNHRPPTSVSAYPVNNLPPYHQLCQVPTANGANGYVSYLRGW